MEIFCKKCGNVQDKSPDDLIGEFCLCDFCGTLFHWYFKNGEKKKHKNQHENKKDEPTNLSTEIT